MSKKLYQSVSNIQSHGRSIKAPHEARDVRIPFQMNPAPMGNYNTNNRVALVSLNYDSHHFSQLKIAPINNFQYNYGDHVQCLKHKLQNCQRNS